MASALMQAMVLTRVGLGHVEPIEIEIAVPGPDEVLGKILACSVCRTDLHLVDGELPEPTIQFVPGHELETILHRICSFDVGRHTQQRELLPTRGADR